MDQLRLPHFLSTPAPPTRILDHPQAPAREGEGPFQKLTSTANSRRVCSILSPALASMGPGLWGTWPSSCDPEEGGG